MNLKLAERSAAWLLYPLPYLSSLSFVCCFSKSPLLMEAFGLGRPVQSAAFRFMCFQRGLYFLICLPCHGFISAHQFTSFVEQRAVASPCSLGHCRPLRYRHRHEYRISEPTGTLAYDSGSYDTLPMRYPCRMVRLKNFADTMVQQSHGRSRLSAI